MNINGNYIYQTSNKVKYCYLVGFHRRDELDHYSIDTIEYNNLRKNVFIENSTDIKRSFTEFLLMAN